MTYLRRKVTPVILGLAHLLITACGTDRESSELHNDRPSLPGNNFTINPDIIGNPGLPYDLRPNCEDPAVSEIRFGVVRQEGAFRGRVSITAVVTNLGRQAFVTGARQQVIQLYELNGGSSEVRMVASQPFGNLNPNQTATLRFERNWSTSAEFPPDYRAIIVYDPDILIDGNTNNDDCVARNNSRTRNLGEVNRLFRR